MLWLYPRESVMRSMALEQKHDPVATDYLRGILKQNPGDVEVRSELIQRALSQGEEAMALTLLEPLRTDGPEQQVRAAILIADILENRLRQPKLSETDRSKTLTDLRATLEFLLATPAALQQSPEWLLNKIGQYMPDRQAGLFRNFAQIEQGRAPYWLERAAGTALASGRYRDAAEAYFQAQAASRDPENQKRYFLEGLKTLQSGQLLKEALAAARSMEAPWLADRDVLLYLTRLSRAAGDNASAERYVRLLLQMALLEQMPFSLQQARWQFAQPAAFGRVTIQRAANVPATPYDEEVYKLAYEVFLGNGKPGDAMAVAAAALRQVPGQTDWIKRLAQAAEWAGHPEAALAAWRQLATRFNSEEGWQGMARLAPSLFADEDLLLLWHRQAARRALEDREWREIQAVYERLARPLEGAAFFENAHARNPRPQLLEQAAYLRHSMGDIDGAIADYRQLASQYGAYPKWAMVEASLLYGRDEKEKAFDVLNAAKAHATEQDASFWRIIGDLAWNMDKRDVAREAYRQRQQAPDWQRSDADRLLAMLEPAQTEERLAISRLAWQKSGVLSYLNIALGLMLDREQTVAAQALLSGMKAEKLQEAVRNPDFLILRSRYHQMIRDMPRARADLAKAHELSPSPELKASLLWFLIDSREAATLQGALPQWEQQASANKPLAEAVAAGWHALGNTQRALFWSRQLLPAHENDPAWLVDYADLIEQSGQPDMAWRIRRHAWLALKKQPPANMDVLQRQLRLSLLLDPVDQAEKRLLQAVVAGQSLLPGSAAPERDAALVDELAYAWLMGQEDDNRARFWHWRRYVKKLADPNYLALRAASMNEDSTTQQRLLERNVAAIQPSDHTVAAAETGDAKVAEEQAWFSLDGAPANDALHLQMSELTLANSPSSVSLRSDYTTGELQGWRHTFSDRLMLTPSTSLTLNLSAAPHQKYAQQFQDTREIVLTLENRKQNGDALSLSAGHHLGKEPYNSLSLAGETRSGRWQFDWKAGWDTPVNDNALLTLAGMQRQGMLGAAYYLRQNLIARLRLSRAWLRGQDGETLGTRNQADLSLDWTSQYKGGLSASLYGQRANYSAYSKTLPGYALLVQEGQTPTTDEMLPKSFGRVGLTLGYGMAYQEGYTRAWRPFMSGTVGHHSLNGLESAWQLGQAGSVLGNDHLSIYGGRSLLRSGGSNSFGGVTYRWYY